MRLIARDRDLADVLERVADGRKLVTIVGPGGVGKTVLAHAALTRMTPTIETRADVVELSRIDRPEAVAGALAAQLGFATIEALLGSPGTLPGVLLVDNCEHVVHGASEALSALLSACEGLVVLATSRVPLGLPEESIVQLAPLAVPLPGEPDRDAGAVRLFCERARDNGVDIGDGDLELAGRLCRRLDGVPLAIELAAARLRVLGLAEVVDRLDDGVDVLARPVHSGADRHRSVHDAIEWSAQLLTPAERDAFAYLGVCAGPFGAELAGAIMGTPANATAVIETLVDSSLLVVDHHAAGAQYRMLEPIRAVALDRLRSDGRRDQAVERLAQHVFDDTTAMIAEARDRWDAKHIPTLVGRFDQIDLALRHSLAHDHDPTRALALYTVMWGMVHQTRVDEVLELDALVTQHWPDTSVANGADAAATYAMGNLLCGHTAQAKLIAEKALPDAARSAYAPATLRRVLGLAARFDGDHRTAELLLGEAADAAARHGVVTMDLECRVYRAQDLAALGRATEALEIVRAVADESRQRKSVINEVWARTVEASILCGRGERPTTAGSKNGHSARAVASEALAVSRQIDYPFGVICNLQTLVACHLAAGDPVTAAGVAGELLDAVARSGAGDLRRALDLAAAILAQTGHPHTADLAATAASLPDTNPMVMAVPLLAGNAAGGKVLERPMAILAARHGLTEVAAALNQRTEPAHPGDTPEPVEPDIDEAAFIRSGDVWQITFRRATVHVQTSKGMEDLAVLLAQPGREITAVDLADVGVEEPSTGEMIDAEARRHYETRIRELQAEIDEAELNHDIGRLDRAQTELDLLVDHLTAAVGLGGKMRRSGGSAERARSAVTHRLRAAVRRIGHVHPALGAHLQASIATGAYCRYDPEIDVQWRT